MPVIVETNAEDQESSKREESKGPALIHQKSKLSSEPPSLEEEPPALLRQTCRLPAQLEVEAGDFELPPIE